MSGTRVVLSVESVEDTDVDALALGLLAKQKEETGISYGHCSGCLAAVNVRAAKAAAKAGRPVRCRSCAQRLAKKTTDDRVFLCSQCRTPLTGRRLKDARSQSKRGLARTCGAPRCASAARADLVTARSLPLLACASCGNPVSRENSNAARHAGRAGYCDEHKRKRPSKRTP